MTDEKKNPSDTSIGLESLSDALARARNHLASERTRLAAERTVSAWMRTALASVGAGFAIIRLLSFESMNHRIMANGVGILLMSWGIVILSLALFNYRSSCKKLDTTINKMNEVWVTISIFVFMLASLFLLLVVLI